MSVEPEIGKTYPYPVEVVALDNLGGAYARIEGTGLTALGVTASDVRQWAREQGLTNSTRGRIGLDLVEAYAAAHPTVTT